MNRFKKEYPNFPVSVLKKAIALQCLPTDIKIDTTARLADKYELKKIIFITKKKKKK